MARWFELSAAGPLVIASALLALNLYWVLIRIPLKPKSKPLRAVIRQCTAVASTLVLAILTLALTVNSIFGWFSTWSSLGGIGETSAAQTIGAPLPDPEPLPHHIGSSTPEQADPANNPVFGSQNWANPGQDRYLMVNIGDTHQTSSRQVLLWLPPSYLNHPERHYPVIVAFSGVPGSIGMYQDMLKIGDRIETLVANQQLREAIVVVPDAFPNNQDTECVDSTDGSVSMETWLSGDLIFWLTTNLRVMNNKDAWATVGFSAGGWCASMLAMRHPDRFGYALSMAGYFEPVFDSTAYRPEGDSEYDLAIIAKNQQPAVRLWFWAAKDDPLSYGSWREFAPQIGSPTSLTTNLLETGGHSPGVWVNGLPVGLAWLGQVSGSFAWVEG